MRVSVLETETFESQSQLSGQRLSEVILIFQTETFKSQSQLSRLRLSEVSLSFETQTEKLLMVETKT